MTKKPAPRDPTCDNEGKEIERFDPKSPSNMSQEPKATAPKVANLTEMFPGSITVEGYIEDKSGNMQRATLHFELPQWLRDAIEKPREVILVPRFSNFVKRLIAGIIIATVTAIVTYMMKDSPIFNGLF
jgi:hypothetical protein